MGEKVYGFHAIEEALKKAGMGSTLYVQRQGGDLALQVPVDGGIGRFLGKGQCVVLPVVQRDVP